MSRNMTPEEFNALVARMKAPENGVIDAVAPRGGKPFEDARPANPVKSTSQSFFVHGPLPGANDVLRKHHMVYSRLKSEWGLTIARCILVAKLKRVQACTISFLWQEPHNRRDIDNICFGAKFILDALRDTKIIPDDARQFVRAVTHSVVTEKTNPGCFVRIEEVV